MGTDLVVADGVRPGVCEAVVQLFVRLTQYSGMRPNVAVIATKGVEMQAVVFVGRMPDVLVGHLNQVGPIRGLHAREAKGGYELRTGASPWAAATGTTGDLAMQALYERLLEGLSQRIESDQAVFRRVTGAMWTDAADEDPPSAGRLLTP